MSLLAPSSWHWRHAAPCGLFTALLFAALPPTYGSGSTASAILQRDSELNRMIVKKEAAAAASFYEDAFVLTTASGKRKGKQELLREIASPDLELLVNQTEVADVHVSGGTAVLTGTLHQSGRHRGTPFDVRLYVTDTWVFRQGKWTILSGHASKMSPENVQQP
jgi:ketosteroid isomerase-like protein